MEHNKCRILLAAVFVISIISGLGVFAAPAAASTTTYIGIGNNRPLIERATNTTSGSNLANYTSLGSTGIPPGGWKGYNLTTIFTNILRNADYAANGQFTSSSNPWTFSSNNATVFSSAYSSTPPSTTTTGSDYLRLQGKEAALRLLGNMNFSTYPLTSWKNTTQIISSGGTWPNIWNSSQEWLMEGYYKNNGTVNLTTKANLYLDQNFTYSGVTPPDYAALTYRYYVSNYTNMVNGSMYYGIVLRYWNYTGGPQDYTIINNTASIRTGKPLSPSGANITSYITGAGKYRVRLFATITLNIKSTRNLRVVAAVGWDDVGVYIRWGKYTAGNNAQWSETWTFNQAATGNAWLIFKYWTNITTIIPSTDSYLAAWVNSSGQAPTQYNIVAFSSITTGSWRMATVSVPASVFNSTKVTIKIGIYIGSKLQINATSSSLWGPRFYFDNVTFFIKYKASPANSKFGIIDSTYNKRWNCNATTPGQGSLKILPARTWNTTSVPFLFVTNGTNGKAGYNLTILTFSYTSTLYASRYWRWTNSTTFTVSDDLRTYWYCNYSTPAYLAGCQNYNITIYVPADWLNTAYQGGISQIKFAGYGVTSYTTAIVNSTTGLIRIPASVFAPNPPRGLLEIWLYSANYIGPSQLRTLLYTWVYNKSKPGWVNATSFAPGNITKLVGYLRNGSGYIPLNVNSFSATIRLYNQSGGFYKSKIWIVTPNSSNGSFSVTLNPWNGTTSPYYQNVTWNDSGGSHGISWYFAVNWTNGYESANGISKFNTSLVPSYIKSTSLTSPKQPYTGTWLDNINLEAIYTNTQNNSGIMGASVTWRWIDQQNVSSPMSLGVGRGNYTATISGQTAYTYHFAPLGTWIQINASRSGFISQSIQARVFVRNVATTGTASSFPVPYQTYDWNSTVSTSLFYMDADHNQPIAGATLKVNNTVANNNIGSSGIRWWYSYNVVGGYYQIFFNATASTPVGLTTWSFNVNATKVHYQSASSNLNGFNIQDRPTTQTEPSLSVTTPWNDTAVFMITYRDLDATGMPPIYGANPSCTWRTGVLNKDYFVTQLSNGTYRFSLNVTGLIPNSYSCTFGFSKTHYETIVGISAEVTVRNIYTSLTSPSSQINVFWGDNQTVTLVYKDLDHTSNISLASWSTVLAYDAQTGDNYTSTLKYNIYINPTYHSWIIKINGSLPLGSYTLWIHASVSEGNGYYVDQWFYPTLNIQAIPTSSATQTGTILTVVWSDQGKIVVNFLDLDHGGRPVLGASIAALIDPSISWSAYENGSGIYTVFLNTTGSTDRPQPWAFSIQLLKAHYTTSAVSGNLQINAISTSLQIPVQLTHYEHGSAMIFNVFFEDSNHTVGIPGALLKCNWTLSGFLGKYPDQDFGNGTYSFNLDSTLKGQGFFTIQIQGSMTHYKTVSQFYTFIIGIVNTSLAPHATPAPAPWGDNATVSLDYDINGTTSWIMGATITSNWTHPYAYFLTATGQWQIDFNTTGLPEGSYWVRINFLKQFYESQNITMSLTIRPIRVEMRLYQLPDKVQQGNVANITIQLWDLDHSQVVTGASLVVSGLNSSLYEIRELGGGYYELNVNTASMSFPVNVSFTVGAVKSHYLLTPGPRQVMFQVISPGLSTMTVIIMSASSAGIVIIAMLGIVAYRRSKIPFIVKKIDQSIKLINKGTQVEAIEGVRTRVDTPFYLISAELESLGISLKKEEPNNKVDKRKESREKKSTKTETKPDVGSKDEKREGGS